MTSLKPVLSFPHDPSLDYYNQTQKLKKLMARATEEIQRLKKENDELRAQLAEIQTTEVQEKPE